MLDVDEDDGEDDNDEDADEDAGDDELWAKYLTWYKLYIVQATALNKHTLYYCAIKVSMIFLDIYILFV